MVGVLAGFLALPKEAINVVVAFVVLLVISVIAVVFPAVGLFFFGVILLAVGFFLKDVALQLKRTQVSVGAIAAIAGVAVILVNLLNMQFHWFAVVSLVIPQFVAMEVTGTTCSSGMLCGDASLDTSYKILVVFVGVAIAALIFSKYSKHKAIISKKGKKK